MGSWVKLIPKNYYEQSSFFENDVMLWQNDNVYVMDNHRDAAWCWLQQCMKEEQYNFMYIDQHYDLLDRYYSESLVAIENNPKMTYNGTVSEKESV